MKFRTELIPEPASFDLNHSHKVVLLGSCFTQHIGKRLMEAKFTAFQNPFGIVYHPWAMARQLKLALGELPAVPPIQHQGLWHNFDSHTSFSTPDKETFQHQWNAALEQFSSFLQQTDVLILTFGTAKGFFRKDNGEVVANCHRYPAGFFEPRLSSLANLLEVYQPLLEHLKIFRPDLRVILTVSPVRHLKDTLTLNSVSKATLRLFCHELSLQYGDWISYFPAFEALMDDLRDYRYYTDDLLHPSNFAQTYIWQKFSQTYFATTTTGILEEWAKVRAGLNHRPRNPESAAHQTFLLKLKEKIHAFQDHFDVNEELNMLDCD
ncbi:MAG: GSCFA domain-containing protein [Bacteroidota bacterium]